MDSLAVSVIVIIIINDFMGLILKLITWQSNHSFELLGDWSPLVHRIEKKASECWYSHDILLGRQGI